MHVCMVGKVGIPSRATDPWTKEATLVASSARCAYAFSSLHPALTFGFFVSALVLSVVVQNPYWIAANIACAAILYLLTTQGRGWKVVVGLIPVFVVVSAINPLFNLKGSTVLFYVLGQRPYTLEALLYGTQTAGMFVSIMLWFGSYNHIMTSDKFTYLFGGMAPSIVLVFTMILRLVPTYIQKAKQIAQARACIGLSVKEGTLKKRATDGLTVLSSLTSWALESSVITADSMRSRGYGSSRSSGAKRTQFAVYDRRKRDRGVTFVMVLLLVITVVAIFCGCAFAEFIPTTALAPLTPLSIAGFSAFVAFLALPSVINGKELLVCRSFR